MSNICKEKIEAKRSGKTTYFTGKPCKNGHLSKRFTCDGKCVECNKRCGLDSYFRNRDSKILNRLLTIAKPRAKKKGIEFSITKEDLPFPEKCPIFGIEFKLGIGHFHDSSPSIDRIDSSKGYIPDNVWIISMKANKMKNIYSLEELETLTKALRKKIEEDTIGRDVIYSSLECENVYPLI